MKRLKYFFLGMDPNTTTYRFIYDGKMIVHAPATSVDDPWVENEAVYFSDDIGYEISQSNKQAMDKPTVTIQIPAEKLGVEVYNAFTADFCLREFIPYIEALNAEHYNRARTDKENGKYYIHVPGGEILVRNTAFFETCRGKTYENGTGVNVWLLPDGENPQPQVCLCLRIQVQLPKKKIRKAMLMLCRELPDAVDAFVSRFDLGKLYRALDIRKCQEDIRAWIRESDYCAFIANGSILPRSKGTDIPMPNAVPFHSTPNDEIEICGVRGMGIKRGVTVITGGGYSGKSTLLDAISSGIYDHAPGDGRELCITDNTAMTISAEDGRSVKSTNISPFIKWLPSGNTQSFSTEHASGSTSQAANIMEAIDCGAKLLLIDEDRSATNFMIRDGMMKELIKKEPITPFTDRVNELHSSCEVSTVLVIGGSGEYLSVADKIYMMDDYLIHDVTEQSKAISASYKVTPKAPAPVDWKQKRTLSSEHFTSYPEGSGTEKLCVSDMGFILIGDEMIDIRGLHDIVSKRQLDSLGYMLRYIELHNSKKRIDINACIDELYDKIDREGLDTVFSSYFTTTGRFLDLPRKCELKAVINRMRKIVFLDQ